MAESAIEWTDKVWNPVSGCTRVSAGCDHCYAVGMTHRLQAMGQEKKYGGLTVLNGRGERHFNGVVRTHDDALTIPMGWKKPARIFVNSMSDLFHKDVPFEFVDKVFAVMALCPQHTFQVLTKRPERMAEYPRDLEQVRTNAASWAEEDPFHDEKNGKGWGYVYDRTWPLPNVWLGTSVEDQAAADERIPELLKIPAAVRFLSMEPLLGPVSNLRLIRRIQPCPRCGQQTNPSYDYIPSGCWNCGNTETHERLINWVIVGGESGPAARPMHPAWVRSIRDQCAAAGVPFFFKQWGNWLAADVRGKKRFTYAGKFDMDDDCRPPTFHEWPDGWWSIKCRKGEAGAVLDDRTHNEMPA